MNENNPQTYRIALLCRSRFVLLVAFAVWLLGLGCGKDSSPPPVAPSPANTAASPVTAEADLSGVLAELTQALRKFSAEKRRVPASLNELVAAGYIRKLPPLPVGKMFAIDPKNLQVIVK